MNSKQRTMLQNIMKDNSLIRGSFMTPYKRIEK